MERNERKHEIANVNANESIDAKREKETSRSDISSRLKPVF